MTKTDFFRVLIKVFGLYSLLIILFSVIPGNISFILSYPDMWGFAWLLLGVGITFALFFFLVRRPDIIIKMLKLDKGFDEERIQFENLNTRSILKLSSIIIGGLLIIDNIPVFLSYTFVAFKSRIEHTENYNFKENIYWAVSFLKLVIGYVLVTNYERVSNVVKEKRVE